MPYYGRTSTRKLNECHPDIIAIFTEVIKYEDCSIIWGHRTEEQQNEAYHNGFSTKVWPESVHNEKPSNGTDAVPYPIDWDDKERFYFFAGVVMTIAKILLKQGIITHKLRWGGDWDGDGDFHDQTLYDLVHFELVLP